MLIPIGIRRFASWFCSFFLILQTVAVAQMDPPALVFTAHRDFDSRFLTVSELSRVIAAARENLQNPEETLTISDGRSQIDAPPGGIDAAMKQAPNPMNKIYYVAHSNAGMIRSLTITNVKPGYGTISVAGQSRESADALAEKLVNAYFPPIIVNSQTKPAELPVRTSIKEYAPIKLSQSEVASLIDAIRDFCFKSNGRHPSSERLSIARNGASADFGTGFDISNISTAPTGALELHYRCSTDQALLSSVAIDMWDFARKVEVQGTSEEQIASLMAIMDSRISDKTTHLGGSGFRAFLGVASYIILLILIFFFKGNSWFGLAGNLALLVIIWLPPWSSWLPGTLIYNADESFLAKYSPQFTFWSFVIAIVGVILSLWYPRHLTKKPVSKSKGRPKANAGLQ